MSESTSSVVNAQQVNADTLRRLQERCRTCQRELAESAAREHPLKAELDAIEEAMMKAGPIGTFRESLGERRFMVSFGKTNGVVGVAEEDFAAQPIQKL